MKRQNVSGGAPWETIVGYSRAVKINNVIEVSGTTATENGEIKCKGDLAGQTRFILEKISAALAKCGVSMTDVVRTRIYVTDISKWEEAGRVHGEFFKDILPATSMVEVSKLIDPEILVEIEATAILG